MTSLDDLVMLVMLVLCICLAILVAYLMSKVNELELKTSSLLQSNQTHKKLDNDVFGGLQGKKLWDAWQVVVSTSPKKESASSGVRGRRQHERTEQPLRRRGGAPQLSVAAAKIHLQLAARERQKFDQVDLARGGWVEDRAMRYCE